MPPLAKVVFQSATEMVLRCSSAVTGAAAIAAGRRGRGARSTCRRASASSGLFKRFSKSITLLFVSHDLAVVASLCQEIVILEQGSVVESGSTREVLARSQHPYTKRLLASVPRMPATTAEPESREVER
jgi:Oligopeptide/dipeptide transporter, C-terminal region